MKQVTFILSEETKIVTDVQARLYEEMKIIEPIKTEEDEREPDIIEGHNSSGIEEKQK